MLFCKLQLMMLIPDIFPNSLDDKMQETTIYSYIFSLCKNMIHRRQDRRISEQWTDGYLKKWSLELTGH